LVQGRIRFIGTAAEFGSAGQPFVHLKGKAKRGPGHDEIVAKLKLDLVEDAPAWCGLSVQAKGQFGRLIAANVEGLAQFSFDHGVIAAKGGPMRPKDDGGACLCRRAVLVVAIFQTDVAPQPFVDLARIDRFQRQTVEVIDPVTNKVGSDDKVAVFVDVIPIAEANLCCAGTGQTAAGVKVFASVDGLEAEAMKLRLQVVRQARRVIDLAACVL